MKRRFLSMLLVLSLLMSLFTACGTSNSNQNSTEIGNNPSEENNITTETEQQPIEKEVKLVKAMYINNKLWENCEYNEYGERIERFTYDIEYEDKVIGTYTTYEYDDYGNLVKEIPQTEYNGIKTKRSSDSKIYEYDEQGRLLYEHSSWDKGETYDTTTEYIYDENGDMIESHFIEIVTEDYSYIASKNICEYDDNHNMIKKTSYTYELESVPGESYYSPTLERLTDEYIYTYDSNNNLTSEIHNSYINNTKEIDTYKYDSNNNKIEFNDMFYRNGEQTSNQITTYKYNEHNDCIEEKLTDLIDNFTDIITREYQYNEDGSYTVKIHEDGFIETRFYDEFGNYIEATGGKYDGRFEYETRTVKVRPTR